MQMVRKKNVRMGLCIIPQKCAECSMKSITQSGEKKGMAERQKGGTEVSSGQSAVFSRQSSSHVSSVCESGIYFNPTEQSYAAAL